MTTEQAAAFSNSEITEVDVRFAATTNGTQITLQHSGWAVIRADHPARNGLATREFSRMIGLWWGDLLTALREHTATKETPPQRGL